MKQGIHPEYHQATVRCACGEEFVVGSTRNEIRLEVCSKCHPFFTGKQKYVDTAGRVDKYFKRYGEEAQKKRKKKPAKIKAEAEEIISIEEDEEMSPVSEGDVEETASAASSEAAEAESL